MESKSTSEDCCIEIPIEHFFQLGGLCRIYKRDKKYSSRESYSVNTTFKPEYAKTVYNLKDLIAAENSDYNISTRYFLNDKEYIALLYSDKIMAQRFVKPKD